MTTPQDIRNFVRDIKSRGFEQLTVTDYERLCQLTLTSLPQQQERRGKKCPHCSCKIGNASKICKHCKHNVRTLLVRIPDGINDCNGSCAKDLTGREYDTLPCGHKFCSVCMRRRVQRFSTCCRCDRVLIPDNIRDKYLRDAL